MWSFAIVVFAINALVFADTNNLLTYKIPVSDSFKELLGYPEDVILNFTRVVTKYGYKVEEHAVTTEDGYILTDFRMRSPNCSEYKQVPVLLQHGAFASPDSWLVPGPRKGLAYVVTDDCYDLWVCSNRGTTYGRKHATLNPDKDADFWKYSVDEMGYYDVPAHIDYVTNATGSEKVNYIGYSQGGSTALIALSERPEYNDKVNLQICLAPAANLTNFQSTPLKTLITVIYKIKPLLDILGIREILFRNSLLQVVLEWVCTLPIAANFCTGVIEFLDSKDPGSISLYSAKLGLSRLFAGSSVQQISGIAQIHLTGNFSKYDYGVTENLQKYNTAVPPMYNLTNVIVPSVVVSGGNDNFVNASDVAAVAEKLPNLIEYINIPSPWNHADVMYGQSIPTQLYPIIKKYLELYV